MKKDPLRRWKGLEERTAQIKQGDLKSALQYLRRTVTAFRNSNPQADPQGYAVHCMASALLEALKKVEALPPFNVDFGPIEMDDINSPDTKLRDIEPDACPTCGTVKKTRA